MSIEWVRETNRDAEYSGDDDGEFTATRSWLVKTTSPSVDAAAVKSAPGVDIGSIYPGDSDLKASRFRARSADSSGVLWTVTWEYKPAPDEGGEEPDVIGGIPGKPAIWSGSSSVTTIPIYKDRFDQVIVNSAGDPLEDITAEAAEDRLTLTQYYQSHTEWLSLSKNLTNSINQFPWNGGGIGEWKCQGCSKKLNIEKTEQGTLVYWEVTWDFAYRKGGWNPQVLDIGFAQLADEEGTPTGSGTNRIQIRGQDGRGVRQPVALANGVAKPAGQPPDVIVVDYYIPQNFGGTFGEVYTPSP